MLVYTSGVALLRQTSTRLRNKFWLNKTKERLLAERNADRSFAFVFFSLFSSVNEYSLLSRLKCMLLATLTTAEIFVFCWLRECKHKKENLVHCFGLGFSCFSASFKSKQPNRLLFFYFFVIKLFALFVGVFSKPGK